MRIRTPKDLGAAIRARRQALKLDQAALAARAGVSRLWINQVEAGKPGAGIGLVLRTLGVLGLELTAGEQGALSVADSDISAVLARARKRP